MRFNEKVALVTGAGSGIGLGIARAFAAEGASIIVADINPANAATVAAQIVAEGGKAIAIPVDVADEDRVTALVAQSVAHFGRIDILVNCAGVVGHKLLIEMDRETWDRQIAVQLTGPFLMAKHVARAMIDQEVHGKIVNISSVAATMGRIRGGAHCASKGGLTMLTKVLAMELGPHHINVNAVAPGLIDVPAQREEMNLSSEYKNRYLQELPLGRIGEPDDIAKMVLFLSSPDSEWITGQLHLVDGGLMAGHFSFQGVHDFSMLYGTGMGKAQ